MTEDELQQSPEDTGPVFLRTVLKRETYDRLKFFAKGFTTGRGDWDFGVAIQILLDNYEDTRTQQVSEKLDLLLSLNIDKDPTLAKANEEIVKEEKSIELLGGHKIKIE